MSKQGSAGKWNGGRARIDERMVEDDRYVKKDGRRVRVQDEVSESDWIERRKSPAGFHRGARVSRRSGLFFKGVELVFDPVLP